MYGRGQRHELDEDDAEKLIEVMRERVAEEWRRAEGEGEALVEEQQWKPKL